MQEDSCYLEAGKVTVLLKLLDDYIKQGRKVLIFSQVRQGYTSTSKTSIELWGFL